MGFLSLLFQSKQQEDLDDLQKQARVQCNVPCTLSREDREEDLKVRIRELNWYGVVVDQVPSEFLMPSTKEEGEHPALRLRFNIPREFGHMDLQADHYVIHRYQDVIVDDERLSLSFSLTNTPGIEHIRNYIRYRNASFIRSEKRKNKRSKSSAFIFILWGAIGVLASIYALMWLLPD